MSLPTALVVALLTATDTYSIASPELSYVNMEPAQGDFFLDYFTQQLQLQGSGIRVTTKNEISALLGAERQRQLMNCEGSGSNCMAELAGSLGADAIITGSIAKTSGGFTANLKVINASDGHAVGIYSSRAPNDDALLDYLGQSAKALAAELHRQHPNLAVSAPLAQSSVDTQVQQAPAPSKIWLAPAAVGAAAIVGSGVAFALAKGTETRIRTADASLHNSAEMKQAVADGNRDQLISAVLLGVGVAASVTAFALKPSSEAASSPRLGATVSPAGAALSVGGDF